MQKIEYKSGGRGGNTEDRDIEMEILKRYGKFLTGRINHKGTVN